jgi:segregation and condensation protein B
MSDTSQQLDPAPEAAAETVAESPAEPGLETSDAPAAEPPVEPDRISPELVVEQFGIETRPVESDTAGDRLRAILEAVIYVADEPLSSKQIAEALSQPLESVETCLAQLTEEYTRSNRGLSIREVAGGYKMSTKPEFHDEIRAFVKKLKPPLKLSLAALETLAVVAYKQPITGPEIMEIRGVQGGGVLKTLLDRRLITTAGRKQVVGRPALYKTTRDFLVQFGLKDLSELPTLKEFEEWSRLALGADEPEPAEAPPAAATEVPAATGEPEPIHASDSEAPKPPED